MPLTAHPSGGIAETSRKDGKEEKKMENEAFAIIRIDRDMEERIFKTKEEAIREAKWFWEKHLTKEEKRKCTYFAVVKGKLDETGFMDLDHVEKEIAIFKGYENPWD